MSVAQKIEEMLMNTRQDKSIEKFQQQYDDLMRQGVIHRKGYGLAGVNVIGDQEPTFKNSSLTAWEANPSK